ncbi:conjugal transfer protein TraH [Marinobacter salicampi]|uniref:conjugal transfer protein TraH n=1 Tax=Marinobacter salicampi TaxID=435907 RepID=UPI001407A7FA|nr:conjugal transfer protein TraH [Marinobacter salicampi]
MMAIFSKSTIKAAITCSALLCVLPAQAGMQDQMETMFSGMANVTAPGTFKTQTRGGVAFGGVSMRTPIVDQNVATWVPPSASGGCGGIDLNGGSFSFIDGQQIVNTLQKIASNAEGYAFQLALDAVYPEAAAWIETFQKKMQSLNEFMGNSCQLAQGLINDTTSGIQAARNAESRTTATISGAASDFAESWSTNWTPEDSRTSPETKDFYDNRRGNFIYRALMEGGAVSAFQDGDQDLAEHVISLIGLTIVPRQTEPGQFQSQSSTADKTGAEVNVTKERTPLFDLDALVTGSVGTDGSGTPQPLQVYRCGSSTDEAKFCEDPTVDDSTFKGFGVLVSEALVGSSSSAGIVDKLMTNLGTFTDEQRGVFLSLPESQGSMIRNLALKAPGAAKGFASKAANSIALEMAYELSIEAIDQTTAGLTAIDNVDPNVKKTLLKRRNEITAEYIILKNNKYGNSAQLAEEYDRIMKRTSSDELLRPGQMN